MLQPIEVPPSGHVAGIYARNDTVPSGERNPGSLHLGTAGESQRGNAWRDMMRGADSALMVASGQADLALRARRLSA